MEHFTWNIEREIFSIGSFALRWYSLLFATGFIIGYQAFVKWCIAESHSLGWLADTRLREESGKELPTFTWSDSTLMHLVLGTVIGARLGHCLFYDPEYYLARPLEILMVWKGGLASHGGYAGVIISMFLVAKKFRFVPPLWLIDRVAVLSIMGGGFIRLGNFFNSEIIGRPTDLPWAVVFQKIDNVARHPTQIYEAIGYFTIAAIGYAYYKAHDRKVLEGRLLGLMAAIAFAFRFFIEFFKENQEAFEDGMMLNMGQLLSVPYILFALYLFSGKHHGLAFLKPWLSEDGYGTTSPRRYLEEVTKKEAAKSRPKKKKNR